jgi:hypothetical protein
MVILLPEDAQVNEKKNNDNNQEDGKEDELVAHSVE